MGRNAALARERSRRWRKANPEKVRETARRYREANPEKVHEAQRRSRKANPDNGNQRRQQRRSASFARVNQIKLQRGCADCGYRGHPSALDFDHLPGTHKVKAVALMMQHVWEKIEAEIAKCEVVCANCHRIRTAERGYANRRRESAAVDAHPSLFNSEAS